MRKWLVRLVPACAALLVYGCAGSGACSPDEPSPGKFSAPFLAQLRVKVSGGGGAAERVAFARVRIEPVGDTTGQTALEEFVATRATSCKPNNGDCLCGVAGICPLQVTKKNQVNSPDRMVLVTIDGFGQRVEEPELDAGMPRDAAAAADAGVDSDAALDAGTDAGSKPRRIEIDPSTGLPILIHLTARGRVPLGTSTLNLDLDSACMFDQGAPICSAGTSCLGGACTNSAFGVEDLLTESDFPQESGPEVCKVAGAPEVLVGSGENVFEPIAVGAPLTIYSGSQGGNHVLISVRTKNMRGRGLSITMSGTQPGSGVELPLTTFFVPMTANGDFCEATGFRYQLDNGGADFRALIGKLVDIKVYARDSTGQRASATARVVLGR